jgi:malonate transporter
MNAVTGAVLPVFGLILLGYGAARWGVLGAAATNSLNEFVVWLALPALLFQAMAAVKTGDLAHGGFLAAFGIGMVATFALSFLLDRRSGQRLADRAIEGLDAGYANTGFMGIPLGLAVFGPDLLPGFVLTTLMTACGLFAFAIGLIELDLQGGRGLGRTVWKLCRALAKNPLVVAPVLGGLYAATGLPLPAPLLRFTTLLGGAASPCALVTIGLFLAQSERTHAHGAVARLVALKLVVQPGITALVALWVFDMPSVWAKAAILLGALPTGTGPFMLAKLYDREAAVTSRVILLSTTLSIVTVSALVAWL